MARTKQSARLGTPKQGEKMLNLLHHQAQGDPIAIGHAPFLRLVKMINAEFSQVVNRWTPEALMTLHEAAEFLIEDFLECVVVENEPRENTGVSDTDSMTKDTGVSDTDSMILKN